MVSIKARFVLVIACLAALVVFQQSYAKAHDIGVEQPVGYMGLAEMLFRHPERLLPIQLQNKLRVYTPRRD